MNQKVNGFDRFLLVLMMLIVIVVGLAFVCMAIGVITLDMLDTAAVLAYSGLWGRLITGAIGVVLLILGFRIVIAFNRRGGESREASVLVNSGEFGSTYITIAALDAMVQKHCRANPKVRECVSHVRPADGQLAIRLKLITLSDVCVPELSNELQSSLKEYIESLSGIVVRDINLTVQSQPAVAAKPMQ